jgi:hypothetical protein
MEVSPKHFKVKIILKLEFWSVLNLWDKNVNDKLSPQYITIKLLKCKYQKWICTLQYLEFWIESYGQKKGREPNSWFNFQPLKPRNMDQWPLIEVCNMALEISCWKLQFCNLKFHIKIHMEILWPHKIMWFTTWGFKNCTWELQGFKPFWCDLHH